MLSELMKTYYFRQFSFFFFLVRIGLVLVAQTFVAYRRSDTIKRLQVMLSSKNHAPSHTDAFKTLPVFILTYAETTILSWVN